jgi:hypothetical protein
MSNDEELREPYQYDDDDDYDYYDDDDDDYDDEREDPQGFWDEMYTPTQWELLKYDMVGLWQHVRHSVLMRISKRYREALGDIPF